MKKVFLCPGQGSQYVGMAKGLLSTYPIVAEYFEMADNALGHSISGIIFKGPDSELTRTINAQPAILTVSVALGRLLMKHGFCPDILAGHSLGEYSALVLSDVLDFSDAVRLVRLRGELMEQAVAPGVGSMAAVLGAQDEVVEDVCRRITKEVGLVEPANYNCPGQVVISGLRRAVEAAIDLLRQQGIRKCIPLAVSAPFHCSLLRDAGDQLGVALQGVNIGVPKIPYVANVDACLITNATGIKERLSRQVWSPVRWRQSIETIMQTVKANCTVYEVGPGSVLSGHVRRVNKEIYCQLTDSLDHLCEVLKVE